MSVLGDTLRGALDLFRRHPETVFMAMPPLGFSPSMRRLIAMRLDEDEAEHRLRSVVSPDEWDKAASIVGLIVPGVVEYRRAVPYSFDDTARCRVLTVLFRRYSITGDWWLTVSDVTDLTAVNVKGPGQ